MVKKLSAISRIVLPLGSAATCKKVPLLIQVFWVRASG